MLGDIRQAQKVYIVCGYTDMRKGLNSLVPFVQQNFGIDPYSSSLFLFCGKRCDRLKALLWEPDGFVLLYKRLDNGRYQWPRNAQEVKPLTWEQFTWHRERYFRGIFCRKCSGFPPGISHFGKAVFTGVHALFPV